jgi:S-adenosylmethionine/arginine decarboxylase-like enzyme
MNGQNMNNAHKVVDLSRGHSGGIVRQVVSNQVWGIAAAIDIYDCDPLKIRDAEYIRRFVTDLCELIEMKRFGDTQIVHFGEDERVAGFSMVQFIETSLISAHFANQTNTVYLDVFSCKPYDTEAARSFSQSYFGGSYSNLNVTLRL